MPMLEEDFDDIGDMPKGLRVDIDVVQCASEISVGIEPDSGTRWISLRLCEESMSELKRALGTAIPKENVVLAAGRVRIPVEHTWWPSDLRPRITKEGLQKSGLETFRHESDVTGRSTFWLVDRNAHRAYIIVLGDIE